MGLLRCGPDFMLGPRRGAVEEDATTLELGPGVCARSPHRVGRSLNLDRWHAHRFRECQSQVSDERGGCTYPGAQAGGDAGKGHTSEEVGQCTQFGCLHASAAQFPAPPGSDFLKAYQYVNTVKQFRDREVVGQVRGCVQRCARVALMRVARGG